MACGFPRSLFMGRVYPFQAMKIAHLGSNWPAKKKRERENKKKKRKSSGFSGFETTPPPVLYMFNRISKVGFQRSVYSWSRKRPEKSHCVYRLLLKLWTKSEWKASPVFAVLLSWKRTSASSHWSPFLNCCVMSDFQCWPKEGECCTLSPKSVYPWALSTEHAWLFFFPWKSGIILRKDLGKRENIFWLAC